jgi:hypothetical protein
VKLLGGSLEAKSNEVWIDTLELRASGWSVKHLL